MKEYIIEVVRISLVVFFIAGLGSSAKAQYGGGGSQGDGYAMATVSGTVYTAKVEKKAAVSLFPNPAEAMQAINLQVSQSGNYTVQVFDIQGNLLWTETKWIDDILQINAKVLFSSSLYVVVIQLPDGSVQTERVWIRTVTTN